MIIAINFVSKVEQWDSEKFIENIENLKIFCTALLKRHFLGWQMGNFLQVAGRKLEREILKLRIKNAVAKN